MQPELHVGEVVIIEDSSTVLLDIVGPNCSLCEGLTPAVSEGIECHYQGVELIPGRSLHDVSEVIIGDLRDEHVPLVPPRVGDEHSKGEAKQSVEPHVIIRGNY